MFSMGTTAVRTYNRDAIGRFAEDADALVCPVELGAEDQAPQRWEMTPEEEAHFRELLKVMNRRKRELYWHYNSPLQDGDDILMDAQIALYERVLADRSVLDRTPAYAMQILNNRMRAFQGNPNGDAALTRGDKSYQRYSGLRAEVAQKVAARESEEGRTLTSAEIDDIAEGVRMSVADVRRRPGRGFHRKTSGMIYADAGGVGSDGTRDPIWDSIGLTTPDVADTYFAGGARQEEETIVGSRRDTAAWDAQAQVDAETYMDEVQDATAAREAARQAVKDARTPQEKARAKERLRLTDKAFSKHVWGALCASADIEPPLTGHLGSTSVTALRARMISRAGPDCSVQDALRVAGSRALHAFNQGEDNEEIEDFFLALGARNNTHREKMAEYLSLRRRELGGILQAALCGASTR